MMDKLGMPIDADGNVGYVVEVLNIPGMDHLDHKIHTTVREANDAARDWARANGKALTWKTLPVPPALR
jgi:hypothetical protein